MIWKFLKQNALFPKSLNWVQHWVTTLKTWSCSLTIHHVQLIPVSRVERLFLKYSVLFILGSRVGLRRGHRLCFLPVALPDPYWSLWPAVSIVYSGGIVSDVSPFSAALFHEWQMVATVSEWRSPTRYPLPVTLHPLPVGIFSRSQPFQAKFWVNWNNWSAKSTVRVFSLATENEKALSSKLSENWCTKKG